MPDLGKKKQKNTTTYGYCLPQQHNTGYVWAHIELHPSMCGPTESIRKGLTFTYPYMSLSKSAAPFWTSSGQQQQ